MSGIHFTETGPPGGSLFDVLVAFCLAGSWADLKLTEEHAREITLGRLRRQYKSPAEVARDLFWCVRRIHMASLPGTFESLQESPLFHPFGPQALQRLLETLRRDGLEAARAEWGRLFAPGWRQGLEPNPIVQAEGGPGDTPERAYRMLAPDHVTAVDASYWLLDCLYRPRYEVLVQMLLEQEDGRKLDLVRIQLADGTEREVYFDVTEWLVERR